MLSSYRASRFSASSSSSCCWPKLEEEPKERKKVVEEKREWKEGQGGQENSVEILVFAGKLHHRFCSSAPTLNPWTCHHQALSLPSGQPLAGWSFFFFVLNPGLTLKQNKGLNQCSQPPRTVTLTTESCEGDVNVLSGNCFREQKCLFGLLQFLLLRYSECKYKNAHV